MGVLVGLVLVKHLVLGGDFDGGYPRAARGPYK